MKILVCGGRDYQNKVKVFEALNRIHTVIPITEVIHGAAPGADSLGALWATLNNVNARPFPADWKTHGKAAGPIRNQQMLTEGKPDRVLAFPGGNGTADMKARAIKAGIQVLSVL
jgi:hypothetical protein